MHVLTLCKPWAFAGLNSFIPRVLKLRVTFIATVLEPSTATSTTTAFAGSLDINTLGANGTDSRYGCHRGCWCWHTGSGQRNEDVGSK